jgi:sodium/potassium-transporting ATPase subunit alpha
MGISGSDVAREAASIILLDDDFASIVAGIREGRCLFDNLTKTIAYTLSHLFPEVIPILLNLACSYPLAIGALQILSIDLGTELAPAVSLAFEPAEDDVLRRPPRNIRTESLVSWNLLSYGYLQIGVIHTLFSLLSFWLVMNSYGFTPSSLTFTATDFWSDTADSITASSGEVYNSSAQMQILSEAQTAYWATLVLGQFAHMLTCRNRRSPIWSAPWTRNFHLNFGLLVELFLTLLLIFTPGVQYLFSTAPFSARFCWAIVLNQLVIVAFNETRKAIIRRFPHSTFTKYFSY